MAGTIRIWRGVKSIACLEPIPMGALKLNERHNLFLIRIIHKELNEALHFAIGEQEHSLDAGDVPVVKGSAR